MPQKKRKMTPKQVASMGGKARAAQVYPYEHMIGVCPSPETYSSSLRTPTINELMTYLQRNHIHDDFIILFCGKAGSDNQVGSTGQGFTNLKSIQNIVNHEWSERGYPGPLMYINNPDNTAEFSAMVLPLDVIPIHITGIVVRRV
jgi:hypothetical protein